MRTQLISLALVLLAGSVAWLWPAGATADVLVLKSGRRIEGEVTDEGDKYQIVTPDGATMHWPKGVVREIIEDKQAEPAPGSEREIEDTSDEWSRSVVEVDLGGKSKAKEEPRLLEVVVTGLGVSPEKALENAFSRAVEQAIGVFVDAETMVRNDELLREQVLTYSRGFIKHYEVIRGWQKEGLHHASIRAKVLVGQLVERLKAADVAVKKISGSDLFAEATTRVKRAESGAALMRKVFADFPANVLGVDVQGEPRIIESKGEQTRIGIKVRFSLDERKYSKWLSDAERVFRQVAEGTTTVSWNPADCGDPLISHTGRAGNRWPVEQLSVPPEKRKHDGWGYVSIPRAEWTRCYALNQDITLIPETPTNRVRYGLAVVKGRGKTRASVFWFDKRTHAPLAKASLAVPMVSVTIYNSAGKELRASKVKAAFKTSSSGKVVFASPIFVEQSEILCTSLLWWGEEMPKRSSMLNEIANRRQLVILPYLQCAGAKNVNAVLATSFCNEFVFEVETESLKRIASVEAKIMNRDLLAESRRGNAEAP